MGFEICRFHRFGDYPWRLRMDISKNTIQDAEEPESQPDSKEKKDATKSRVQSLVLSDSFGTTVSSISSSFRFLSSGAPVQPSTRSRLKSGRVDAIAD